MEYEAIDLPKRAHNLTGKRFGRLTATAPVNRRKSGRIIWLCVCDCGKEHTVASGHLVGGKIESCGCLRAEVASARSKTHGQSHQPVYYAWKNMIARCTKPSNTHYQYYGGRGIKVCKRWRKCANFIEDMGIPPEGMSLDRIDYNGDYTPDNCRWATAIEQARNKSNNRMITLDGKTKCLAEWVDDLGLKISTVEWRLKRGWSDEKALSPVRQL